MKKFPNNRETKQGIKIQGFKHPIPLVSFRTLNENNKTCVFLFVGGLGGTIPFLEIMNYPFFDNHYLVGFEHASHGANLNKPKRWPSFFLKELNGVIDKTRELFPNKRLFILGESWGAALACLYSKRYANKINGVFCWNMPHAIKDASHSPWSERLIIFFKMLLTIPFGIPCKDYHAKDTSEVFSSNEMLVRLSKIANANKIVDLRLYLASWWSFKPAWRFLNKNIGNDKYNIFYIQSGEDFMAEQKYFNKFQQKWITTGRVQYFDKGFHVLSMEEPWNEQLYKFIDLHI